MCPRNRRRLCVCKSLTPQTDIDYHRQTTNIKDCQNLTNREDITQFHPNLFLPSDFFHIPTILQLIKSIFYLLHSYFICHFFLCVVLYVSLHCIANVSFCPCKLFAGNVRTFVICVPLFALGVNRRLSFVCFYLCSSVRFLRRHLFVDSSSAFVCWVLLFNGVC